jgi:hypothetical protein
MQYPLPTLILPIANYEVPGFNYELPIVNQDTNEVLPGPDEGLKIAF